MKSVIFFLAFILVVSAAGRMDKKPQKKVNNQVEEVYLKI
jgi:hypothetical protein